MTLHALWSSGTERQWHEALTRYWDYVLPRNRSLEQEFDRLNPEAIRALSPEAFYQWLCHKYFVWKYTDARRLATARKALAEYQQDGRLQELAEIHHRLFTVDRADIRSALEVAHQIRGLGVAGASGLLAVLFPQDFGTVDRFVCQALATVPEFRDRLPPEQRWERLSLKDAVTLIALFREIAQTLNARFGSAFWTPRKVDMVCWGCR